MSAIEDCTGFLGTWTLLPASCVHEQGDPPREGQYRIMRQGKNLRFDTSWTDATGERHEISFEARPNGVAMPFDGGGLADALSVTLVSERQLDSTAWLNGKPVMHARRTLSDSGRQMTISQTVNLPDGTSPTNWSTYERVSGP